jgi:hypothetical protein
MKGDLNPARRMYAEPELDDLLDELPELMHSLCDALDALQSDPGPARCASLIQTLYGAQTHIQRLRTALERRT